MIHTKTAWPVALVGTLSAGAALGTGELLSGLFRGVPSLVISVANVVVDETPGGIVRWTIDTFGTSQKTLLVFGVVVSSLIIGALFGLLSRSDLLIAVLGFAAFGAVGGWAAARQASSSAQPPDLRSSGPVSGGGCVGRSSPKRHGRRSPRSSVPPRPRCPPASRRSTRPRLG